MSNAQPNILILMPDQLRADAMSCAGHPMVETPNMDRLASEGVRFSNAYTVCPICMPARASFISGLYPHNHGMWTNSGSLSANDETFFHHLQKAGYYTAHVGKSHYYPHGNLHMRDKEDYMHARGIDYVHETTGPWATVSTDSYMTDHWQKLGLLKAFRDDYIKRREVGGYKSVWASPLPVDEFMDSYIGRRAAEFIESYDKSKPFCLFVGFGGPHEPWDAPGEYAEMYKPDDTPPHIPLEEPQDWVSEHVAHRMKQGQVEGMNEGHIRKIRANYYGKVSLIDRWFGEIFSVLEQKGFWDNTMVVFWSDHGEMAGDHQRLHKSVFYDSSVRVPLIIRMPDRLNAGDLSEAFVENIDVYPTLLDAVGAEPSKRCFSRSLMPVLQDTSKGHRNATFCEINSAGYNNIMIRTDKHKYAIDNTGKGYMLYDISVDSEEQINLIGHPDLADVEKNCRDRILEFLVNDQVVL